MAENGPVPPEAVGDHRGMAAAKAVLLALSWTVPDVAVVHQDVVAAFVDGPSAGTSATIWNTRVW